MYTPIRFNLWKRPWFWFAFLLIALISTTALYFQQNRAVAWMQILPVKLAVWLFWGLYAVLIFRLTRTFIRRGTGRGRAVVFHILFSLFSVLIHIIFYSSIVIALDLGGMRSNGLQTVFLLLLPALFEWYFIIYWAIVIATYAFDLYNKYRDQELQTLQLEKRLIQAQLQSLKMQLHPHFLFNTLNTIAAQVRLQEKHTAVKMLAGLSELLRTSLKQRDRQMVSLDEEVQFIRQYLDLEKQRFGKRLQVGYEIDPAAAAIPVPAFLLQPLVENAVYHGLAKKIGAEKLLIRAIIVEEWLDLEIYNEGLPLPPGFNPLFYQGIGLSNTLERLSQVYGENFNFRMENCREGVAVLLAFPIQSELNE